MTQFRVLPVRRGDAYLLSSKRGSYLIDGGTYGNQLPEMLKDRRTGKLRAAICTSTKPERIGGILELMESGYRVSEYWFPDTIRTLTEMARRFNGDWEGCLELTNPISPAPSSRHARWTETVSATPESTPSQRPEGATLLIALAMTATLGSSPYAGMSRADLLGQDTSNPAYGTEHFFTTTLSLLAKHRHKDNEPFARQLCGVALHLFSGTGPHSLVLLCARLIQIEIQRPDTTLNKETAAIVQELTTAAMVSALLSTTDSTVRFFRQVNRLTDKLVPRHPLKCLNGVEVKTVAELPPTALPDEIFRQADTDVRTKEGLTFQYGDALCSVLLCGDTRFSFLGRHNTITLDRPTAIAAPRQGYCSADPAYGRIVSTDPSRDIWVRSHYSYARKVSPHYKDMPDKICLNDCVNLTVQEILLRFDNDLWITNAGGGCACG